jgi:hypothetical protein
LRLAIVLRVNWCLEALRTNTPYALRGVGHPCCW